MTCSDCTESQGVVQQLRNELARRADANARLQEQVENKSAQNRRISRELVAERSRADDLAALVAELTARLHSQDTEVCG